MDLFEELIVGSCEPWHISAKLLVSATSSIWSFQLSFFCFYFSFLVFILLFLLQVLVLGQPGEEVSLELILRVVADVGLVVSSYSL